MTEEIKKLIIYTRKMKKREPLYRDYPEEFREEIRGYLESNHISRLYAHQVEMFEKVRAGENVVITTSTASGKTLAFFAPGIAGNSGRPADTCDFYLPDQGTGK